MGGAQRLVVSDAAEVEHGCGTRRHGRSTGQPRLPTVRFPNQLAAVRPRCAGNGVLISGVHFKPPTALDSQAAARCVFGRFRLFVIEKYLRPHDSSDGEVMRLRMTQ